jgi:hypothetical protein
MISTLLFVYVIKGLKLLAYAWLFVAHGSALVAQVHRHRIVQLSYLVLLVVVLLELLM